MFSVFKQTFENWELIVIDDDSTDGSLEKVINIAQLQFKDKVRIFKRKDFNQNKGGANCRNIGAELAVGQYLFFLDADDILTPDCLEHRYKHIIKIPTVDFFIFNNLFFIKSKDFRFQKNTSYFIDKMFYSLSFNKTTFFLKRFLSCNFPFTISNIIWRRNFFIEIGGFDERYYRFQDPQIHTNALLTPNLELVCFKYNTKGDVLIRIDPARHIDSLLNDEAKKFKILIENSVLYLSQYSRFLNERHKSKYIQYLNGYFFNAEIRFLNMNSNLHSSVDCLMELKKLRACRELLGIQSDLKFKFFLYVYRMSFKFSLTKRMKIPQLINILYKV